MALVLSFILFVAYILLSVHILRGGYVNKRTLSISDYNEKYYEMNPLMFYLIFVIVSAPLFLVPPFSLAKYAVYCVVLLVLLKKGQIRMPDSWITKAYWLFFIWLVISAMRSAHYYESIALLVKYSIPILSLYLGYSAVKCKYDIYYLIRFVLIGVLVYTFLIGGLAAKFYSWFYFSVIGNQFLKYAGFADYQTSLFVLPFIMVWFTGSKKWYWIGAAMLLSTILEVVRTGLGGMFTVLSCFLFYKYKWRSMPLIGLIVAGMLAVILFVPEVNQKFFGENAGNVSAEAIIKNDAMSLDNIQTSGRNFMWTVVMNNCYEGHEMIGSGLGSAGSYLKYLKEHKIANIPILLHNDYVQIMCDTGLVGLSLLILFFLILLFLVTKKIWNTGDFYVKITGIMAIASSCGVAFSMGFDNVVSHSMTSFIMPFIFTGIYLKNVELSDNDEILE